MIFDLMQDFAAALDVLPKEQARQSILALLDEAIRRDAPFIARHPTTLFQCTWNATWWYGHPEEAEHYEGLSSSNSWLAAGEEMRAFLEAWRRHKEQQTPGLRWLRSLRPPALPLNIGLRHRLLGHESLVSHVAYSPDGRLLGSAGADVRLWDVATGQERHRLTFEHGRAPFVRLAFSPDGIHVAAADHRGHVCVWEIRGGNLLHFWPEELHFGSRPTGIAYSPDGRWLACCDAQGDVRLIDATQAQELWLGPGNKQLAVGVFFTRDSSELGVAFASGQVVFRKASDGYPTRVFQIGEGGITRCALAPNDDALAVGAKDGLIQIVAPSTGAELRRLRGLTGAATCITYARDGSRLAAASEDAIAVWDTTTGKTLFTLEDHEPIGYSVAFCPEGQQVACGTWVTDTGNFGMGESQHAVTIWNVAGGARPPVRLQGHRQLLQVMETTPDGATVITTADDETLRFWDFATGKQRMMAPGDARVLGMELSPDGRFLATWTSKGKVRVVAVSTGQTLAEFHDASSTLEEVAFPKTGGGIWTRNTDGSLVWWDLGSGEPVHRLCPVEKDHGFLFVALSDRHVVVASRSIGLTIWDAPTGKILRRLAPPAASIGALAANDRGTVLAQSKADGAVSLWDVATGRDLGVLRASPGPQEEIRRLGFVADDRRLMVQLTSGLVEEWDLETRRLRFSYRKTLHRWPPPSINQERPIRAVVQDSETAIVTAPAGAGFAWHPEPMRWLATHPSQRTWAGISGPHLLLFTLDGEPAQS